jgi:general secretion pathway protein M
MRAVLVERLAVLEPHRTRLLSWWRVRSSREQILLGALGGLALLALLLIAVVRPLQAARSAALADIRTYQSLAARLRAAGPPSPGAARPPVVAGDPAQVIATTAAAQTLVPREVAAESGGFRVTLADAPYDAVLRWLATIEASSPLRVASLSITRGQAPGLVAARVVLSR